jgi:diacylglycerol kinase (ATP)
MPLHLSLLGKTGLHRPIRAKLIFNPASGQPADSPFQLVQILSEMQRQNILPEVFLVQPDSSLEDVAHRAVQSGIPLIVVAGGDGTIDAVVGSLVGRNATLGVIPTGTRNNVAFNLGIPGDIPASVALLRNGHRMHIDVGRVHNGHHRHWFLEGVALGLLSDLYPMADNLQHGDLAQIGGLLSTLVSSVPSHMRIHLGGRRHLTMSAHMMLIANMPFLGPHFQISPDVSFQDGHLDVFTFSDMSKLNMISSAMLSRGGLGEDAGILHYRSNHVSIVTAPPMPVLADGIVLEQGSLSVHVHARALQVMAGTDTTGQNATERVLDPRRVSR